MTREPRDRLDQSRCWMLVTVCATIAILVSLSVFSLAAGVRSSQAHQVTRQLIGTLNLDRPALAPTGRTLRNPGYANPAVDLRHSPFLPLSAISLAHELLGRAVNSPGRAPVEHK